MLGTLSNHLPLPGWYLAICDVVQRCSAENMARESVLSLDDTFHWAEVAGTTRIEKRNEAGRGQMPRLLRRRRRLT
jgi:hypothetical protein